MENPYQPPVSTPLQSPPAFHWGRVVVWAVLIYAAANVVGVISGLSMGYWEIYGRTLEEAIPNARLIRRIAYFVVVVVLYWRFAAGVDSKRLLHVLALFVLVRIIDLSDSFFVYSTPTNELIDYPAIGRAFLAATLGLGMAWLGSNHPFRPKPQRGS